MPSQIRIPTQRRAAATPHHLGDSAVVLGASLSGLLTARVLADFYRKVTVVDRDRLTIDAKARRGVPQATHAHVLLPRGAKILDELFPGFLAELRQSGVPVVRRLDELHFELSGHLLSQQKFEGEPQYGVSRPFLESRVLRRVKALPNVTVVDKHEVLTLDTDATGTRVTGARIACGAAMSGETVLAADLVVAATGRGGQVGSWLTELGYPLPKEQQVKVDIMYATRRLRLAPGATGGVLNVLIAATPNRPIGMGAFAQEDDHWMVTLAGFGGHHPPLAPDAWLDFADRMAPTWFVSALKAGIPLDEVHSHRFPANLRRRYDKLATFPDGLLVVGDALCSFNPIYGQGMTVAALEVMAMRDTLMAGSVNLAKRYFHAASKPIASAWQCAAGADLTMPPDVVPGARWLQLRAVNAYVGGFQTSAQHDPALALHFLRVTGLDAPVRNLFAPTSLGRVALRRLHRRQESPHAAIPEPVERP